VSVQVAVAQVDVAFADVEKNLATVRDRAREAAARGAKLVVFPECVLTGYAFSSLADARKVAVERDGRVVAALTEMCVASNTHLIVGTLELGDGHGASRGRAGSASVHNAAWLIGPRGVVLRYHKLHLPFLGCDRFVERGDLPLDVATTPLGRIGMAICYDGSFPETARVLKLRGAQLMALPTNWPEQATVSREVQPVMRAFENHFHHVACNRVGSEGGFRFPGGSSVVDFTGRVVARAGAGEELLLAELDLEAADRNRVVLVPGEYELDRIGHRRPEHYGEIVKPVAPARR
jgi:predicted amidohydrolase